MFLRRSQIGTDRGPGLWGMLVVLSLAVLVPTACVVWFMNAAMRNERLAVRQRLSDLYRGRAAKARAALEAHWSAKAAALDSDPKLPPARHFAKLVRGGIANSVIVYNAAGKVAYPSRRVPTTVPEENSPQWRKARELEYKRNEPEAAVEAYAEIAEQATDDNLKARALQGQVRCLVRLARKQEAIKILNVLSEDKRYGKATDVHGRLIAPDALLFAIQLIDNPKDEKCLELGRTLTSWVNDYSRDAIPSTQRRFLMRQLRRFVPPTEAAPTLEAEELAAMYLETEHPPLEALRLTKGGLSEVWQMGSSDKRTVAIFSEKKLLSEMTTVAQLTEPFAGATLNVVPPRKGKPGEDAFLSLPVGDQLPRWELQVHIVGKNPFAAAASRQRAVYLWTAVLGIMIVVALGLIVAGYLTRQMRLTRLKNNLIATVSHELKTPLASMRVLVDTLLENRCRDEQQAHEYFGMIARENRRLSRLIDNFLTFSRMERNKRAFEFVELQAAEIVSAAIDSTRERFDRSECRLDVHAPANLPPIIGDRDALITVLLNLLDNAYKYSGDNKRVALRSRAEPGWVCFEVSDNGIGMSRRATRKIFDRFYRVDQTLSRSGEGCGLGLSIVKFIVEAHGGLIAVDSQAGRGSTFTVRLPAGGEVRTADRK